MQLAKGVLAEMASRFPRAVEQIRWILIDDKQLPSALGDPERYPTNGYAYPQWSAFQFYPRGLQLMPFRIPVVSNFEGVFTHELTHLIQKQFEEEWAKHYQWAWCYMHEDEWEYRVFHEDYFLNAYISLAS